MKRTRPATATQPDRAARSSTPVWALAAAVVLVAVGAAALFVKRTPSTPPVFPAPPPTAASFVGSGECKSCHAKEYEPWASSQHARAMQHATADTVRGDFNDTKFTFERVTSSFFRRDGKFFVRTDGPDGKLADFEVKYTFGVEPLQQYLVELPGGRLQALAVTWDTRPKEQGGQRWFRQYPAEKLDFRDELHWTQRSQNWNFMCADCHSSQVTKGYDAAQDTFDTRYKEIAVGCEACHGPGSTHIVWAQEKSPDPTQGPDGAARRAPRRHVEHRRGDRQRKAQPGAHQRARDRGLRTVPCAARADRRGLPRRRAVPRPLPAVAAGAAAVLRPTASSATRSSSGVRGCRAACIARASPAATATIRTRRSCASKAMRSAASATRRASTTRRRITVTPRARPARSAPTATCRARPTWSSTRRRDHSMRVPRPDQSVALGVPNACNQCHTKQDAKWAAAAVRGWLGRDATGFQAFAPTFHAAEAGQAGATASLATIANDLAQRADRARLRRRAPGAGRQRRRLHRPARSTRCAAAAAARFRTADRAAATAGAVTFAGTTVFRSAARRAHRGRARGRRAAGLPRSRATRGVADTPPTNTSPRCATRRTAPRHAPRSARSTRVWAVMTRPRRHLRRRSRSNRAMCRRI